MHDKSEWYNLKNDIASYIAPKLRDYQIKFAEEGVAIPTWLLSDATSASDLTDVEIENLNRQWFEIIGKMANAFELVLKGHTPNAQIELGLELFSRYYQHLWD
ncbi:hypothetical protein L1077_26295 [Pseudoalteromonas luteoviolacea]|uniref:hypothetical protein n=1 Tax=Pseudoalteromonas luteoviolacea TaxID=43657 RepID=UPI001F39ABFF|nr:hypothetical protein [Pseudoalteromonas luteoviolacea]MCF6442938.1 hypothetical protein [Pseudoalteromonas luteoviolacea]